MSYRTKTNVMRANQRTMQLCYICGKPGAGTKDHVPPECLFPRGQRSNLIKVPAHKACNQSFSKDDEYFKLISSIEASWQSPQARQVAESAVLGLLRPESTGFCGMVLNSLARLDAPVWRRDLSGVTVPATLAMRIAEDRTTRVVSRIVKGLYYHYTGQPLAVDWPIKVYWAPPEARYSLLSGLAKRRFTNVGNGMTLRYWWSHIPDDDRIGWFWLVFFGHADFHVFTGMEKSAPNVSRLELQRPAAKPLFAASRQTLLLPSRP